MLTEAQVAEIRRRVRKRRANYALPVTKDALPEVTWFDAEKLLADRDELVRRLAKAEAELQGLQRFAERTVQRAVARAAPVEDARP